MARDAAQGVLGRRCPCLALFTDGMVSPAAAAGRRLYGSDWGVAGLLAAVALAAIWETLPLPRSSESGHGLRAKRTLQSTSLPTPQPRRLRLRLRRAVY